jgi:hypothetical protein
MTVRRLSFIAPVFLLTASQLSSPLCQVRHLSLKILDLFLKVASKRSIFSTEIVSLSGIRCGAHRPSAL